MKSQTPSVCIDDGSHAGSMGSGCEGWWDITLSRPKRRWYRLYARTSYWNDYRYSQDNIKTPEQFVDALDDAYSALDDVCGEGNPDFSALEELDPEFARQARALWEKEYEEEKSLGSGTSTLGFSSMIFIGRPFGKPDKR